VIFFFVIPLKRGTLKMSSWRYQWLNFYGFEDIGSEIDLCHLPRMIFNSSVYLIVSLAAVIFFSITYVLGMLHSKLLNRFGKFQFKKFTKAHIFIKRIFDNLRENCCTVCRVKPE